MPNMTIDAFTENILALYHIQGWDWGCSCGATIEEIHDVDCQVTPLFAETAEAVVNPREVTAEIAWARMSMEQHVIRCAECGQEMLAKDALVIYQAPLDGSSILPGYSFEYKYPKNIVKAVCPYHNRAGTVGYQRMGNAGYGT